MCSSDLGYIKAIGVGGYAPTGYTYNLVGPVTSGLTRAGVVTFDGLAAGNYTIQITDSLASTYTTPTITLVEPNQVGALISTSANTTNPSITFSNFSGGTSGSYTVYCGSLGPISVSPGNNLTLTGLISGNTYNTVISRNNCPGTNYIINLS